MLPAAEGVYPPEAAKRRFDLICSYATPTTEIDVDFLPGISGFVPWGGRGDTSPDRGAQVVRTHELAAARAAAAEQEGYDAFCPFGGVDVGVELARHNGVQIPCIGSGEASFLFCGLLGCRFASCHYLPTPDVHDRAHGRARDLGVADLYVGPTAIGMSNDEFPDHHDEVLARYRSCADEARGKGAEMMGMFGQSICPIEFSAEELHDATGLPAMDGIAAQIAMAEWWHRMGIPTHLLHAPRRQSGTPG